jgi:serine/threonine protein kinase
MPLAPGAKLGPYEIVSPIGAGGMGEVYRARDTRLDRSVAIKIVSGDVTTNPELRQRFEREARALSSLSHPHICALYDIGQLDANGSDYLVMEYLEGETLAKRLERGPLPIRELLKVSVEVADALDKAHRQGLVHRDLKPGNIMLTKSGAKLLDFGLAKAQAPAMAAAATFDAATAAHPTSPITQQGFLVGTFQYMSPEQVQGKEADSRSDIFAFGAVLYEMATGKRAFDGKSQIGIASAILEKDPEPISSVQSFAPPALEHIVERALAKDPDERWQSASDIKAELKWIAASGSQPGLARATAGKKSRTRTGWAIFGVVTGLAILLAAMVFDRAPATAPTIHSTILPPDGTSLISSGIFAAPLELSPDGTKIAFVAGNGEEPQMIWVRQLDTGVAKQLAGTENASRPFWSPDSKSVGFFAERKLKKIDAAGGPVFTLADAVEGRGGTWNSQGLILYSPAAFSGLYAVPAAGGPVREVTKLDPKEGETTHRYPEFLPDGKHFLYLTRHSGAGAGIHPAIEVASLDGGEGKHLIEAGSNVKYVAGYLLYVREHALMAQKFDDKKLEVSGDPITISDDVMLDERFSRGVFSVSRSGLLAYQAGSAHNPSALRLVSRSDTGIRGARSLGEPAEYFNGGDPTVSPDGKSAIAAIVDLATGQSNLWRIDLATGQRARITSGGDVYTATWSPDGKQIAYIDNPGNTLQRGVTIQSTTGSGAAQLLLTTLPVELPEMCSWTPDGKSLLYISTVDNKNNNLWQASIAERKPSKVFEEPAFYSTATISPDGHFMTYVSDQSGRDEVYVATYPALTRRWQISQNGGFEPRWRRDGKELFFFAADNHLQAVPVKISGTDFEVGQPQSLFAVSRKGVAIWRYDVLPDGQHFVVTASNQAAPANITLVTNWTNLLAGK